MQGNNLDTYTNNSLDDFDLYDDPLEIRPKDDYGIVLQDDIGQAINDDWLREKISQMHFGEEVDGAALDHVLVTYGLTTLNLLCEKVTSSDGNSSVIHKAEGRENAYIAACEQRLDSLLSELDRAYGKLSEIQAKGIF